MAIKGLYRHSKEDLWCSTYTKANLEYETEGPMTITQNEKYVLVQVEPSGENNLYTLNLYKDNNLCMRGSNFRKLNKEEMIEELMWCIKQYEKEQKQ